MKKYLIYFICLISIATFFSCEKAILGAAENNEPENNFELLWNDFEKHYGLFEVKQVDWHALYDIYRPQVTDQTTDAELWTILTSLLENLDDGHVNLEDLERDLDFESGFAAIEQALEEFDLELIKSKYLSSFVQTSEEVLSYGSLKNKDIGYMHFFGVSGDHPEVIDEVVGALKNHQAIIVDLRNNGGGEDDYAERIAGAFADGEHFIYTVETRNGSNYDDFDKKKEFYTHPKGEEQFLKPVILLTDKFTASGAEIMTFHMKSFAHVTHIGDFTAGDFSDLSNFRFLPNGWIYSYSIQKFLTPNGESLESIGHEPEIFIKNTKADIEAGNDKVMEKAIDYLREEYGIE